MEPLKETKCEDSYTNDKDQKLSPAELALFQSEAEDVVDPMVSVAIQESLQQIVKKAEKPMNLFHHSIYACVVDFVQVAERVSKENFQLKERIEVISRLRETDLTEREQIISELQRDRDEWKAKAEYLSGVLENYNTNCEDQRLQMTVLKAERDKYKADYAKSVKIGDAEQTKFSRKLHEFRKTRDDQTLQLQKCETSLKQMTEKIKNFERKLSDGKTRLKREKKRWSVKLQKELTEKHQLVAQQTKLQKTISSLEEKSKEQKTFLKRIADEFVANPVATPIFIEKFSELKETSTENGQSPEKGVMSPPPPAVKRKVISAEKAGEEEVSKKVKLSTAPKEVDAAGDLAEEGEIFEQEAQQEKDKPVVSSSLDPESTHSAAAGGVPSLMHINNPVVARNRSNHYIGRAKSTPAVNRYHQQRRFYPQSNFNGTYKRSQR